MKSTLAVLLGLFAATISAAPVDPASTFVTVSLSNDISGSNAAVPIPIDGVDRNIATLFEFTPIAISGQVFATSAQLIAFPQGVFCVILDNGNLVADLSFEKTFADLDRNPEAAVPQNMNNAVINCQI